MKRGFQQVILTLALCPILSFISSRASLAQSGVSWQQSQAPSVTLGVRDKYGTLGGYTARFVITDAAGHKAVRTISVHEDDFGFITYPDDSLDYPTNWLYSGNYSWACVVRGRVVARGKFSLTDTPKGQQIRTTDPF